MAGDKNSGRKSYLNEKIVKAVINKSWGIISDVLNKQGYSKETKQAVALEVVKRTAPKNIEVDLGENGVSPILVKIIKE